MKTWTRLLMAIGTLLLLSACATSPPMPSASDLFTDAAFHAPHKAVSADRLFAMSAPMKAYLDSPEFRAQMHDNGRERGLFAALYKKGELQLEYDSTETRDAAGTFAAKKGNCLSLVIMTAAFAKELGLDVTFQTVLVDEQWSRSGSLYVASSHVNLNLPIRNDGAPAPYNWNSLTIDFAPPSDADRYGTVALDEQTIAAMYLNNRAAEELAENRIDDAYWWARAAVEKSPNFIIAYNTLGVVYQRHGDNLMAEKVYRRALQRERDNTIVMHNLIPVLQDLGKGEEAKALTAHLALVDPTPPFYYFSKGMLAMQEHKYSEARALFAREVKRSPYNDEFHFWLGIAHWYLNEPGAASNELTLALEASTTEKATKLYSTKLNYLRSLRAGAGKRDN